MDRSPWRGKNVKRTHQLTINVNLLVFALSAGAHTLLSPTRSLTHNNGKPTFLLVDYKYVVSLSYQLQEVL